MIDNVGYSGLNQIVLRWICTGLILFGIVGRSQAQTAADCKPVTLSVTIRADATTPVPPVVTPVVPPTEPPTSPALTLPVFNPQSGLVGFGDKVSLSIPGSPADAVTEFSTDAGKTWTPGNEVVIDGKKTVSARSRQQDRTSAVVTASFSPYYRRVMVIGNSIMSHGPAPELGWLNFNGMAASAPEKDFVHILTNYLSTLYPQTAIMLQSGGGFEREFGLPNYSLDEFNQPLQTFKPDLIVIRIGENVDDGAVNGSRNFESQFRQLVERLATYGQPVRIVTTTSVWNRPNTDTAIRKVINDKKYTLVDLGGMVGQGQYFASQYPNPGVAAHPNDAGMQQIANLIWEATR